ncbi:COMM domain-containing protein 8 isoform X2 [Mugil cephalus]|uniref:COMM domain-containing protein 8 isoform X2 n=1 Tax=Mugil cephalus TaxID=48193 RepID=UPI001FB5CF03|nr:COMM domain-containing protein 8 isoform X2 [Mugil cephalus]
MLQTCREAVLVQIKAEITASFKEIKTDIGSLREETKADIRTIRDELTGELARLHSAQAETATKYEEMGTALCETMDRLCHSVVEGLCGREPPHREDYITTWSLQEWLELINSLTALFRLSVMNNNSDEEVLAKLSDISSSHAETVLSVLRTRQEEIRSTLLDRTNSISSSTLQDFDWQLKPNTFAECIFAQPSSLGGAAVPILDR